MVEDVFFACLYTQARGAPSCHGCALRSRPYRQAGCLTCIGQAELHGARQGTRAQVERVGKSAACWC